MNKKRYLHPGITPIAYLSLQTRLLVGTLMGAFIIIVWLGVPVWNYSQQVEKKPSNSLEQIIPEHIDSSQQATRLKVERSQL